MILYVSDSVPLLSNKNNMSYIIWQLDTTKKWEKTEIMFYYFIRKYRSSKNQQRSNSEHEPTTFSKNPHPLQKLFEKSYVTSTCQYFIKFSDLLTSQISNLGRNFRWQIHFQENLLILSSYFIKEFVYRKSN